MVEAQADMNTSTVIAYMAIAGVIGFLIDIVMLMIERVLLKWREA